MISRLRAGAEKYDRENDSDAEYRRSVTEKIVSSAELNYLQFPLQPLREGFQGDWGLLP